MADLEFTKIIEDNLLAGRTLRVYQRTNPNLFRGGFDAIVSISYSGDRPDLTALVQCDSFADLVSAVDALQTASVEVFSESSSEDAATKQARSGPRV